MGGEGTPLYGLLACSRRLVETLRSTIRKAWNRLMPDDHNKSKAELSDFLLQNLRKSKRNTNLRMRNSPITDL